MGDDALSAITDSEGGTPRIAPQSPITDDEDSSSLRPSDRPSLKPRHNVPTSSPTEPEVSPQVIAVDSDSEDEPDHLVMNCNYVRWLEENYMEGLRKSKATLHFHQTGGSAKLSLRMGETLEMTKKSTQIRSFKKINNEDLPNAYVLFVAHGQSTAPIVFSPSHSIGEWFDALPCGNQVDSSF